LTERLCFSVAKIKSWEFATKNRDENLLQSNLYSLGPLSVCVEADSWQFYRSGVITSNCGDDLDHCVLLTGWGKQTRAGQDETYWILRNSWGTSWGENGYIRILKGKNLCGIADEATTARV